MSKVRKLMVRGAPHTLFIHGHSPIKPDTVRLARACELPQAAFYHQVAFASLWLTNCRFHYVAYLPTEADHE
jgi:hypothetical protein